MHGPPDSQCLHKAVYIGQCILYCLYPATLTCIHRKSQWNNIPVITHTCTACFRPDYKKNMYLLGLCPACARSSAWCPVRGNPCKTHPLAIQSLQFSRLVTTDSTRSSGTNKTYSDMTPSSTKEEEGLVQLHVYTLCRDATEMPISLNILQKLCLFSHIHNMDYVCFLIRLSK